MIGAGRPDSPAITGILSGGGVKAAAHLGALGVLFEAGLAPTRYVATSMGAVIAAMVAGGIPLEQIAVRLGAVRRREVFRPDRAGLLKGMFARSLFRPEPVRRLFQELLPVAGFGDLATPLSVVATDLDTGELLVFGAGGEEVPLLDALCASSALPPFFPPFPLGGRRCADGGLRAVVPLEVAARFEADLVVAIDVGAGFDTPPDPNAPPMPALLRLQTDAQRILMASNTTAQYALWLRTPGRPPLRWIRPRVRRGDTFALEQLSWYVEEGARAARAALREQHS